MNSTSVGLKNFKTNSLTEMFCILDEWGCLYNDPKKHQLWEPFMRDLKFEHGDVIAGILIFSYKWDPDPEFLIEDSYALMLVPKINATNLYDFSWDKVFNYHIGRKILEYIPLV